MSKKRSALSKNITKFFNDSTIHGLPFLTKRNLHPIERITWVLIIIIAAYFSISLCLSNWRRFSANPTVVTIQKDFRNWNNYFPAATGCLLTKYDPQLAENYIMKKFKVNSTDENYKYYLDFIRVITNLTYYNADELEKFEKDDDLHNINFFELATTVIPKISGTLLTFETHKKVIWKYVMTELGICYTVNSKLGYLFGVKIHGDNESLNKDDYVLKCHYLNGLCYARYDADPTALLKLYVHSYLDVVHVTSDAPLIIKESEELEINYRMQETTASSRLHSLSPKQRGCRFDNEPLSEGFPAYSSSICYVTCRYKIVMKHCHCKPFFYHTLPGKYCDMKGLLCMAKYASNLTQSPSTLGCKCPQDCNLIKYLPMPPKRTVWQYGYFDQRITFRWGLLAPTTKYNRDILFGFEDLVVSFGGILALFLGVSFISTIEFAMFILEMICNNLCCKKRTNKTTPTPIIAIQPASYKKPIHVRKAF